jgi:chitin disaccharide deacetylase
MKSSVAPGQGARVLIVNADDFGLSAGVNSGIIVAHESGIVTSASLMVRGAGFEEAAEYARGSRSLSVGIHIDLGEWTYCNGQWAALYEVVPLNDHAAVGAEIERQLELFWVRVGRLPTHIDSHQHVHKRNPLRDIVSIAAAGLGVPLRHFTPAIAYCGAFYGQSTEGLPLRERISVGALQALFNNLPTGITELACHPGYADGLMTTYRDERALEVETLCSTKLRALLAREAITLVGFAEVAPWLASTRPERHEQVAA